MNTSSAYGIYLHSSAIKNKQQQQKLHKIFIIRKIASESFQTDKKKHQLMSAHNTPFRK